MRRRTRRAGPRSISRRSTRRSASKRCGSSSSQTTRRRRPRCGARATERRRCSSPRRAGESTRLRRCWPRCPGTATTRRPRCGERYKSPRPRGQRRAAARAVLFEDGPPRPPSDDPRPAPRRRRDLSLTPASPRPTTSPRPPPDAGAARSSFQSCARRCCRLLLARGLETPRDALDVATAAALRGGLGGDGALMVATRREHSDAAAALLAAGCDSTEIDACLHAAAGRGSEALVEALLEAGGDAGKRTGDPRTTAVALASRAGHAGVLRLLLKDARGAAAAGDGDGWGRTPLHEAVFHLRLDATFRRGSLLWNGRAAGDPGRGGAVLADAAAPRDDAGRSAEYPRGDRGGAASVASTE